MFWYISFVFGLPSIIWLFSETNLRLYANDLLVMKLIYESSILIVAMVTKENVRISLKIWKLLFWSHVIKIIWCIKEMCYGQNLIMFNEIVKHSSHVLLGCGTMWWDDTIPTFWRSVLSPPSG